MFVCFYVVCMYVCMYVCLYDVCMYVFVCMYVCMYVCRYVCMYVCMYVSLPSMSHYLIIDLYCIMYIYMYVVMIMMIISKLTNESIQKIDSLFRRRTRINLLSIIAILLLGSVALSNLEGYSFVTSLYLAVQTITVSGVEQYRMYICSWCDTWISLLTKHTWIVQLYSRIFLRSAYHHLMSELYTAIWYSVMWCIVLCYRPLGMETSLSSNRARRYVPILLHAISLKPNWEHLKIN